MYRHSDEIIASTPAVATGPSVAALIPIMAVVLTAFLIIGLALPVLPLQVHQGLGFGTFIVGLVTDSQFGASLLSRLSAGHYADRRGPAFLASALIALGAATISMRLLFTGNFKRREQCLTSS
jgi:MFS family permease